MKRLNENESHPIRVGFTNGETKVLIVGTFPPKEVYETLGGNYFFYSSARNHFWNIMEDIFPNEILKKTKTRHKNLSFEELKLNKENFSVKNKIGFIDFFSIIIRQEQSSKDKHIINVENIVSNGELNKVLKRNNFISRICCTYKLAYDSLIKSLDLTYENPLYKFENRIIEIILLYPATRSGHKKHLKK